MPKHPYSVHPSMQMMTNWVADLPRKTGKSLDQWIKHINSEGPKDEKARRDWLAKTYKFSPNIAWTLAEKATHPEKIDEDTPEGYLKLAPKHVDEQYAGKKQSLRPLYDKLLTLGLKTGKDATASPCKTFVPLFRNYCFAQIKPTTNTRIDLGLALAKYKSKIPAGGRIIDTGGKAKKDRITHRIPISSVDEIDAEVAKWLKTAYDLDA
jgi:hypothetical protein